MNLAEQMQYASDLAVAQFPATIGAVTAIVPVEEMFLRAGDDADVDYLAAIASTIYFIEELYVCEAEPLTGTPHIRGYDIAAVSQEIINIANNLDYHILNFWCTRLQHAKSGTTAGSYSIVYNGFQLTYSAP